MAVGSSVKGTADSAGIEAVGLVREFKKGPRAVDGIDLRVEPGEIYGFLGPNGAGKSTTVLMLTTLLPPTAGTARVAGFDIVSEGPRVRSAIGAALQEAALDPLLTGNEHMRLQTALHGLGKAEREERGDELLERVGLTKAADRKVGGYSGGMKRRLDLALALAHQPRILFLDEPTTGLDIQSRTALWEEVARLAAEDGVTVFLTTQYLEEADALADRVGIIDHGNIVAEGTPDRAEGRDRPADGRSGALRSGRARAHRRRPRPLRRARRRRHQRRRGPARRRRLRTGRGGAGARRRGDRDRDAAAARALARRRLPRQDRPQPRGRRGGDPRRPTDARAESGRGGVNGALTTQVGQLARRSVVRTLRQPAQIVPSLIFPLFLLAVNSGGLKSVTDLPGFPTDSYLTFALAITFMQGALFSVINSGTDLARDIETGFLNRMALTPLRGAALLSGLLAGSLMLGLLQALAYLIVGLAFGAELTAGVGGFFVIIALSV